MATTESNKKTTTNKAVKKTAKKTSRKPRSSVVVHERDDRKLPAEAEAPAPNAAKSRRRILPVGTVIKKRYKGHDLEVKVVEGGFEYDGQLYRSITAVAKHITGYHLPGTIFFKV